jgi:hypothetical protein
MQAVTKVLEENLLRACIGVIKETPTCNKGILFFFFSFLHKHHRLVPESQFQISTISTFFFLICFFFLEIKTHTRRFSLGRSLQG